jgi:hypothetical protein
MACESVGSIIARENIGKIGAIDILNGNEYVVAFAASYPS